MPILGYKIPFLDNLNQIETYGAISCSFTGTMMTIYMSHESYIPSWMILISTVGCSIVGTNCAGAHAETLHESIILGAMEGITTVLSAATRRKKKIKCEKFAKHRL